MDATDMRYLELLSRLFPSADKASAEIINLSAILNLPKGTEFFASDIHGEYEAFSHTLRNGSGSIRLKIDDVFGDSLSENEKRSLATLIYYPREKMELVLSQVDDTDNGSVLKQQIADLEELLEAYRCGILAEKE